nr:formyltetrahydrofolate deformylase [Brevundimonas sp. UBA2416]
MPTATLLIHCPDKPGLVHDVTGFILSHQGNIIDLQQHIDPEQGAFFMRLEWSLERFTLEPEEIESRLQPLARRHQMRLTLSLSSRRKRVALLVSRDSHCLYDLLARHEAGDLPVDIPLILSNHEHLRPAAERFGIPFHHFPVTPQTKDAQEQAQISLLRAHDVDTLVLARYMQILSPRMIEAFPLRILNIHHSFLPAFVGARPYHQAYERGVKLIGATCHYVTSELDAGPIIEQDVIRIDHSDSPDDMVRYGKDIEKTVLARGLRYHLEDRVLVHGNKTVVFR